ncbi:hypothetical protein AB1Y20_022614 [Prymnesium parvum]|uniref:PPIase cyclophilin-type domain-containing protein n=1 Tax=Prymnesium parvum TaxID=97485 RepID=A0AB34JHQ1_PRYPA
MATREFLEAARRGDLAELRRLHATSESPDALCAASSAGESSCGHTALHWLAAAGHDAAVAWLLGLHGVEVDRRNRGGSTALHSAAANGHAHVCRRLMRQGARADAEDTNGMTPFDAAAARGHAAAARALPSSSAPHVFLQLAVGSVQGQLIFKLFERRAPRACANFVGLAEGFQGLCYRGSRFHRLLPQQVIQGGVLRGCAAETPVSIFGGAFADERGGLDHPQDRRGLLCLASSGVDSNGSQFFITLAPCPHLSGRHVVFGELVAGDDMLELASSVPVNPASGKPTQLIAILDSGRWPPAETKARGVPATAQPAMTLEEVSAAASSTTQNVASAIAHGLKRAATDSSCNPADGAPTKAARHGPKVAMWDAMLATKDDGSIEDSSSECDESDKDR